jgi:hypothetical protein
LIPRKPSDFEVAFVRFFLDLVTIGSQRSFESFNGNTAHSNDITLPSDRVDRVQLIIDPSEYFNVYVNNSSMSHRNYLKACILSCNGSED